MPLTPAICEAVTRANMRFVATKTPEQQSCLTLHRTWHLFIRQRLAELIVEPTASADRIAKREGCSTRKVNMTISLAFLAPDLVKAVIDGRLRRGMGVARLCDMPVEWSRAEMVA